MLKRKKKITLRRHTVHIFTIPFWLILIMLAELVAFLNEILSKMNEWVIEIERERERQKMSLSNEKQKYLFNKPILHWCMKTMRIKMFEIKWFLVIHSAAPFPSPIKAIFSYNIVFSVFLSPTAIRSIQSLQN